MRESDAAAIDERFFRDSTSREQFRAQMLSKLPGWYSPWAHLAATIGSGLAMLALAIFMIEDLRAIELLIVPFVFVVSNVTEWHAHKNLLHRRFRPMAVLYDRHTPEHHRVYRYGDMEIRSWNELRLVLIPAMGVVGIIAGAAPGAALAGWLFGSNVAWLFLLTTSLYVVSYEVTHLTYHLPQDSFVGRLSFVRVMREHHARHHDPRLMQRYNFNVNVPLADWVFGTMAPRALVEEIRENPTAVRASAGLARTPPIA
jgi:hypothetical protein